MLQCQGQVKCLLYLLSSLGIALHAHAIAILAFYIVIIQSSSASSLKFLLINDGIYTLYSVGVATHLCAVIVHCAFLNCFKQNC